MSLKGVVTTDDLDDVSSAVAEHPHPRQLASSLVAVVDESRLADESDTAYALTLAAEILAEEQDLPAALGLVQRAMAADPDDTFAATYHGVLLLRQGNEVEGMAALEAVRPRLDVDPEAGPLLGEAMEDAGRTETAVAWLSAALTTVMASLDAEQARGGDVSEDALDVAYCLAQERHRLRHVLDLPHDEFDELAEEWQRAAEEADEDLDDVVAGLFWPQAEHTLLVQRWPALAETYGADWDAHRAATEQHLTKLAELGAKGLSLVPGSVDGLVAYASEAGVEPDVVDAHEGYADRIEDTVTQLEWPPERNDACWCGSTVKYKKCCLPRSRAS